MPNGNNNQKSPKDTNVESIIRDETGKYLAANRVSLPELMDETTGKADEIHDGLMYAFDNAIQMANAIRKKAKLPAVRMLSQLPGHVAAQVLLATGDVRVMQTGSSGYKLIVRRYYRNSSTNWEWKWAGFWEVVSDDEETNPLWRVFRMLCPSNTSKDRKQFLSKLWDAKSCLATQDKNLVYFRNGVWDYTTRSFTAYDDPNFDSRFPTQISLGKLPVYHPYGAGPLGRIAVIRPDGTCEEPIFDDYGDGMPWKASQMLTDPFDMNTPEGKAAHLIILQAMQLFIRKRNSAFGHYHFWINAGGGGRNGKGMIWAQMKRMIEKPIDDGDEDLGDMSGRVIVAAVEDLSENYILAKDILTAYAVVGEESNGTVTYIDRAAIPKMLARKQELTFRNIYEKPFKFTFDGFLLQQSNKTPIFAEKNDSVISHTIVIPFEHTFPAGRAYIKSDYVQRDIVASFYAYLLTVGMDPVDDYDEEALKVLEPYKRNMLKASMNTFQFCDEALPGIQLSIIPLELLYSLYTRWCAKNGVTGKAVVSFKTFQDDMEQYGLNNDHQVKFTRARMRVKPNELKRPCPAMHEWGRVFPLADSEFMYKKLDARKNFDPMYFLNEDMFKTPDKSRMKLFNRGCLERDISYDNMHYDEYKEELEDVVLREGEVTEDETTEGGE